MATQDLPPPGGFGSIPINRVPPRPLLRQGILAGMGIVISIYGWFYLQEFKKRHRVLKTELIEHFIAVHPFLLAEQERKYLQRLWYIREEEKELMKDVPNWTIGQLYGEKVVKTLPKEYLPALAANEYRLHRSNEEYYLQVQVPDYFK